MYCTLMFCFMSIMFRELHKSRLLQAHSISRAHASDSVASLALLLVLVTGYSGLDSRRDLFIASGLFLFYIISSIRLNIASGRET
jgi:hypothetical protein